MENVDERATNFKVVINDVPQGIMFFLELLPKLHLQVFP